jgi:D-alanyl-D-alanine carboxypeptidase (penicillin-binding protein 5/6)
MRLKLLLLAAATVAAAVFPAPAASARAVPTYKGAIAIDAATGTVLFAANADAESPPASMTKLMTFAVLWDYLANGSLSLDTKVEVTREDAKVGMLKDSTAVWLKQGEVFSVEDLIYAMMIQSANDAAYALAHKAAGTVPAFVALMNAKARDLGMYHSTFRSPHGFPPPSRRIADGDLTTPRDYSLLCRYLLLHTNILRYTAVKTRTFGVGVRLQPVQMNNHNNLLGKVPGVDGLKTGFTNGAGFCISATAQRDGRRVVVVMMGSPDSRTRDLNVQELITQAFQTARLSTPFEASKGTLAQPARPTPAPAGVPAAPDGGAVIHYPGEGGK